MNNRRALLAAISFVLLFPSCGKNAVPDNTDNGGSDIPVMKNDGYELSYWVDMDLQGAHLRGYWYDVADYPEEAVPEETWISNSCRTLSETYGADKLYVIYHRQYEPETAKEVFRTWLEYGKAYNLEIVPTLVLQSYSSSGSMNFTDMEASEFSAWSVENICASELAVYDVYTRDAEGSDQDRQLKLMKDVVGDILTRVGLQPGVALNASYSKGVEDTWTAECQGRTNELWENPVYYRGTKLYGRLLLESWVMERIEGDSRPVVWDMIPVAWDYDTDDELSYDSPGDDAIRNDPPISGRITLCHKYISGCYEGGTEDILFGGYSCDLHILQANSAGRGEQPSFYQSLREGTGYSGDFAAAMNEIGELYKSLKR